MKIAIIGSGNTATVLGKKMVAAGHIIPQIFYYRNQLQATTLANLLGAVAISEFWQLDKSVDVVLLAITDSALPAVAQFLPPITGLVLHTAGSVSMDVLSETAERYGVLYPLQSLRKEKTDYGEIPLLIDGNTKTTLDTITAFTATISSRVMQANDTYRLKLHTAAVVVSNFTNHLYSLAADYCQNEHVDFSLLHPLITETAERLAFFNPAAMQTGPALRHDEATITRHLEILQKYSPLQKLYAVLTQSIQGYHNNP